MREAIGASMKKASITVGGDGNYQRLRRNEESAAYAKRMRIIDGDQADNCFLTHFPEGCK